MPLDVIMPALGMAQETGRLVAWRKAPGEAVAEGEPLFDVETDKATMEVEAPGAGYLTGVTVAEGADVPVGQVIARISDSPEDRTPAPPAEPEAAPEPAASEGRTPEGDEVIMPVLGMAQDSGRLVRWLKEPGEAVAADDVLFEVETDKTTAEVPAGADGFLAALLAEPGDDVPTGQTIAVISAEKPDSPIARRASARPAEAAPETKTQVERPREKEEARPAAPPRVDGRILASPKARRLALEQGLDLAWLAEAGHPQPYHVKDLDTLRALPVAEAATAPAPTEATRQITAQVAAGGQAEFLRRMEEEAGVTLQPSFLWAAFAAGAFRTATNRAESDLTIEVMALGGEGTLYRDPDRARLSALVTTTDAAPDLRLRDLSGSPITSLRLDPSGCPALSIAETGGRLHITLDFTAAELSDEAAIALATDFARRLEDPLMHLI